MPVQNLRVYQFIGESLDGGPGNARMVQWPPGPQVPAAQTTPTQIQTLGFRLSATYAVELASFLATLTSNIPTTAAPEMVLKNQNPFWVTFTVTANGVNASLASLPAQTWNLAVPPYGLLFVGSNVTAFTGCVAGVPLKATAPGAQSNMQRLNFDLLVQG